MSICGNLMHDRKMGSCEIVESVDELGKNGENARHSLKHGQKCSIEDDINQLFEAIDIRKSVRGMGRQESKDRFQKSAMKKPIKVGLSQASGIGISEPVSLKQALRGLCISQASEMAAMKRLSRPVGSPGISDARALKKLYRTVVVDASNSSLSLNEGKGNLVEISLVPERSVSNFTENVPESQQVPKAEMSKMPPQDDAGCEISKADSKNKEMLKTTESSSRTHHSEKLLELGENFPSSIEVLFKSIRPKKEQKSFFHSEASVSSFNTGNNAIKSTSIKPGLIKPAFRNKNFVKQKAKQDSATASSSSSHCNREEVDSNVGPSLSSSVSETPNSNLKSRSKEKENSSPASSSTNCGFETKIEVTKCDERSISRERGEFSHSSKGSIGEYCSSSTSVSDESNLSGSSRSGNRPHMSKDLRWEAIHHVQKEHKSFGLRHFKLLNKLGSGDIGTVYLAELNGTSCLFALKVMDNEFLARRKKMARAITEREILQMLDHPFLPTLFAHFTTEKFLCLVMEHCPGGDLHVLRQKQPGKSFSEQASRFYVAEVLLAVEYLHMLGVVYRDLKPENVLVREDGHIMLSDFDLSLRCAVHPTLVKSSSSSVAESPKKISSHCTETSCIEPFCLHGPSWQVPCFTPRILSAAGKTRKLKSDLAAQVSPLPQLVAEPTDARSNSFVGTHEYLAPEIIKGEGHGSAVDWWMFGIFLYELLYGKTPFKGPGNEETLANVVSLNLKFPECPIVSFHARDLIRRLLKKEPEKRLGSVKGAAEIKQHPFFEGLNWALVRCAIPPELPKLSEFGNLTKDMSSQNKESTKCQNGSKSTREDLEFEIF